MATIHPSRMGLIPQDMRSTNTAKPRGRSPSPRRSRRSPSPPTRPSRSRDRDRGRDRRDYEYDNDRRERSRGRDEPREGRRRSDNRRGSPEYDEYRQTLPPPADSSAPWRQPEKMYPGRGDHSRHGGPTYGSGGSDFLESRRVQRETRTVNVWPSSPKAPARELSPKRKKSSKKTKRQRSPSVSETSSDEEERRRKERKERKRARKVKEEDERRERHRRQRSLSRRRSSDDESDDDKHQSKDARKSKSIRQASRSRSPSRSPVRMDQDDHVEHPSRIVDLSPSSSHPRQPSFGPPLSDNQESDDDDDIGPQPMQKVGGKKVDERSYGGALLRGEGSAMAAFLQDGIESRIPRRGEIGLTSDQIAQYEDVGYVMSGSRHRRMNAVRMRKENQVISAEEKRGILTLQRDERERREAILREEFSELVNERLKGSASEPRAK